MRDRLAQPRVPPTDFERLGAHVDNVTWEIRRALPFLTDHQVNRVLEQSASITRLGKTWKRATKAIQKAMSK